MALAPIAPPAPPRLSTTKGWPSSFCRPSAAMRPMMSVEPPGGNGMISVTGFAGHDCASADATKQQSEKSASSLVTVSGIDRWARAAGLWPAAETGGPMFLISVEWLDQAKTRARFSLPGREDWRAERRLRFAGASPRRQIKRARTAAPVRAQQRLHSLPELGSGARHETGQQIDMLGHGALRIAEQRLRIVGRAIDRRLNLVLDARRRWRAWLAAADESRACRVVEQHAERRQMTEPLGLPPRERMVVHLERIGARFVGEYAQAIGGAARLGERIRTIVIVSRRVVEHAERHVEPHSLSDADAERIAIVAAFLAQHADSLVHAVALRVAYGAVLVVAGAVPEQAERDVVPGALAEHVDAIAVDARIGGE